MYKYTVNMPKYYNTERKRVVPPGWVVITKQPENTRTQLVTFCVAKSSPIVSDKQIRTQCKIGLSFLFVKLLQ